MRAIDVTIVGGGAAGYTAALYLARAQLAPVVVEGVTAGGALMTTTEVENFPGFRDGVQGPALMLEMRAQAERFGATFVSDDAVALRLDGPVKTVTSSNGTVEARAVVLATGSAWRRLGVDGEERLLGRGVSTCATCDGFFFRDRRVAVVGGGDTAVEEALFLSRFASEVVVVHRRAQLRASRTMQARAFAEPRIRFLWDTEVIAIRGADAVQGVDLRDADGVTSELAVSGVFVAIGHVPRSELLSGQLELDPHGYVVVDGRSSRTGVAGVFAAGDLVDPVYRQAITAAGSGCAAALDAERYLSSLERLDGDPSGLQRRTPSLH